MIVRRVHNEISFSREQVSGITNYWISKLVKKLGVYGLKEAHFDKWPLPNPFFNAHAEALTFLLRDHLFLPSKAIKEIKFLNYQQARLLKRFYSVGLRAKTIHDFTSNNFTLTHFDTAVFLVKNKLSIVEALEEMFALSLPKVELLLKYYQHGLRGDHLRRNFDLNNEVDVENFLNSLANVPDLIAQEEKEFDAVLIKPSQFSLRIKTDKEFSADLISVEEKNDEDSFILNIEGNRFAFFHHVQKQTPTRQELLLQLSEFTACLLCSHMSNNPSTFAVLHSSNLLRLLFKAADDYPDKAPEILKIIAKSDIKIAYFVLGNEFFSNKLTLENMLEIADYYKGNMLLKVQIEMHTQKRDNIPKLTYKF